MYSPERLKDCPWTPVWVVLSPTLACEILMDLLCILVGLDIHIPPFCRLRALFFSTRLSTTLPTTTCVDLPPFWVPLGIPGDHDFVIFTLQFSCENLLWDSFGNYFNTKVIRWFVFWCLRPGLEKWGFEGAKKDAKWRFEAWKRCQKRGYAKEPCSIQLFKYIIRILSQDMHFSLLSSH